MNVKEQANNIGQLYFSTNLTLWKLVPEIKLEISTFGFQENNIYASLNYLVLIKVRIKTKHLCVSSLIKETYD